MDTVGFRVSGPEDLRAAGTGNPGSTFVSTLFGGSWDLVSLVISTLIGVIDSIPIGSIVVPFWDYLIGF